MVAYTNYTIVPVIFYKIRFSMFRYIAFVWQVIYYHIMRFSFSSLLSMFQIDAVAYGYIYFKVLLFAAAQLSNYVFNLINFCFCLYFIHTRELTRFNKIAIKGRDSDGKWTRQPSNNFSSICIPPS